MNVLLTCMEDGGHDGLAHLGSNQLTVCGEEGASQVDKDRFGQLSAPRPQPAGPHFTYRKSGLEKGKQVVFVIIAYVFEDLLSTHRTYISCLCTVKQIYQVYCLLYLIGERVSSLRGSTL